MKHLALSTHMMNAPDWHSGQTDKRTNERICLCRFVCLFVCFFLCLWWRLTLTKHISVRTVIVHAPSALGCQLMIKPRSKGLVYLKRREPHTGSCIGAVRHRQGPAFSLGRIPCPNTRTYGPCDHAAIRSSSLRCNGLRSLNSCTNKAGLLLGIECTLQIVILYRCYNIIFCVLRCFWSDVSLCRMESV